MAALVQFALPPATSCRMETRPKWPSSKKKVLEEVFAYSLKGWRIFFWFEASSTVFLKMYRAHQLRSTLGGAKWLGMVGIICTGHKNAKNAMQHICLYLNILYTLYIHRGSDSLSLSLCVICDLKHLGQYEVQILNPGGYISFHGISMTSKPGGSVLPKT